MINTKDVLITKAWIEDNGACSGGKEWGIKAVGKKGLKLDKLLPKFERADWMLWTLRKTVKLEKVQWVELAIICAKTVLDIYEKKYPDNKKPREAIEAAVAYVANPSEENRMRARAAADAYAAAYADAAAAAAAAYAAADAADAYAAAYAAADAAAAAADAYAAAYADARKKHHLLMCKLIREKISEWK